MSCQQNEVIAEHHDEMYRETLMKAIDLQLNELMRAALRHTSEPADVDTARHLLAAKVVRALRTDARMLLGL